MKKSREYAMVYSVGSIGYCFLECIWRGYTHWSMGITGGICFLGVHISNLRHTKDSIFKKCLRGCGIITAVEFCVGCFVNRTLKLGVWDYSKHRGNVLGQVCPFYSILWFLLCIPLTFLSRKLKTLAEHK